MGAWYVFSALGFYPMNPDSGVYAIGSPVVSKAALHLDADKYQGHTFTVLAENNGPENIYIQSATLNGQPLNRAWLRHEEIVAGGTLRLAMGPKPNTNWGRAPENRPPATMPADFHYDALPTPASDKPVVLPLPIRIICGSEEQAGPFQPDPNMACGSVNYNDSRIDVSASNAAPEAIYQSERYAQDFAYSFVVPKGRQYRVRLHFAEIFDNAAGKRLENIQINGQPVLEDFDIFTAAGGLNKAIVKNFSHITPDARGNIVVRVSASPASPDKNAKINGIEILEEKGT
jgi:hypothetical protein